MRFLEDSVVPFFFVGHLCPVIALFFWNIKAGKVVSEEFVNFVLGFRNSFDPCLNC